MEDLKEKTIDLGSHVEDLADTFYRLAMVNVTQKASDIISGLVATVVLSVLAFFVLLFAGLALAWWLGDVLNSRIAGFLLAAFLFLTIMFVISYFRKKKILPLIRNLIIRKMYD